MVQCGAVNNNHVVLSVKKQGLLGLLRGPLNVTCWCCDSRLKRLAVFPPLGLQTQSGEEAAVREHHGGLLLLWRAHPLQDLSQREDCHTGSVQGAADQERELQVGTCTYSLIHIEAPCIGEKLEHWFKRKLMTVGGALPDDPLIYCL